MKAADTPLPTPNAPVALLARLTQPLWRARDTPRAQRRSTAGDDRRCDDGYTLFEAAAHERAPLEHFIRENYARNFGARIDAFMPHLFGLRDSAGTLCGAFGLRTTSGKLFLEQYLHGAIETEIGARCGHAVARAGIVEIGHFCGAFAGAARAMIYLLTLHLRAENFTWVSFTGTRALRNAFARMGLPLLDIAPADCRHLSAADRAGWGSYYAHAPHVMAGAIADGYSALALARLAAEDGAEVA